jgi:hypothetical protein
MQQTTEMPLPLTHCYLHITAKCVSTAFIQSGIITNNRISTDRGYKTITTYCLVTYIPAL